MNPELLWFLGCPLAVVGITLAGTRAGRRTAAGPSAPSATAEEEPVLVLAVPEAPAAGAAHEAQLAPGEPEPPERAAPAPAPTRARALLRRASSAVVTLTRRRADRTPAHACAPDVDDRPEDACSEPADAAVASAGVAVGAADARALADLVRPDGDPLGAAALAAEAYGHGVVDLAPEGQEEERQAGDAGWAARVGTREAELAATLAQRDAERARELALEAQAEALRAQAELERIAVAEDARVRAEARTRRWFMRLDADLDAPTVAERSELVATLGMPAAWAGKLLREAYEQEEDSRVRARILGALAAGGHLAVSDPFEQAMLRGGLERAAVWEVLRPRQDDAQWIAELLEPLLAAVPSA